MCFLLGNINDFNLIINVVFYENLCEVDKYMLIKLNDLVKNVKDNYEVFEFFIIYY